MSEPTFAQEEYADALVERLRNTHLLEAEAYGRKVARCQDRLEMSCLIDEMKTLLQEAEEEP